MIKHILHKCTGKCGGKYRILISTSNMINCATSRENTLKGIPRHFSHILYTGSCAGPPDGGLPEVCMISKKMNKNVTKTLNVFFNQNENFFHENYVLKQRLTNVHKNVWWHVWFHFKPFNGSATMWMLNLLEHLFLKNQKDAFWV